MLGETIKSLGIRGARFVASHAPEILMALGTVGVVSGTVIVAKQSTKLEEELGDILDAQDDLKRHKDEFQNEKEYKKELLQIKLAAAKKVAKIYAPGTLLVVSGVVCFFGAFGMVKKQNGILAASLAAANKAFNDYRARVIKDQGEEKDKEYLYGLKREEIEVKDENGETKKVSALVDDKENGVVSRYAIRFTPEFTSEASTDVNYNLMILKSAERSWNALLPARKKVYLNEIYHELGVDETWESRMVGWDYDADKFGDGKIQFIITEVVVRDDNDPLGYHKELIVDFNVDGDIAHKLPKNPQLLGMEVEDHVNGAERVVVF